MDRIYEINMDDLEKEIQSRLIGTMLVCSNDRKIYMHLVTSESINKPVWTQLISDDELGKKLKEISVVDKVKWLFGSQFGSLPDGTDMTSLPFGYYKPKKVDDEEILGMK